MTKLNTQNKWFYENPMGSSSKKLGLNKKYGKYNWGDDARVLYEKELREYFNKFSSAGKGKTLIVGANDGRESKYVNHICSEIYGVDLASDALKYSAQNGVIPIVADVETLPFVDEYFDSYIALRVLFSQHTNLEKSLNEANRVLKKDGRVIISVPNGYLVNGIVQYGMYDYDTQSIDKKLPYTYAEKVSGILKDKYYRNIEVENIGAEIFISAVK